jgi:hypothetical protein
MEAYHFLKDDMKSNSGNEPAWSVGETRTYDGEIVICQSGYHSSPSWYDALSYAPGNMACIVDISKPLDRQDDKYVSKTRKLVSAKNAEKILRTWACDCAERALKRSNVTDERSWNAIKTARLYNDGEATKEELAAASAAASDAARAASAAASDAAWAASDAASDAARAAWAASDAARAAEIKWQKQHLNKLMKGLFDEMSRS